MRSISPENCQSCFRRLNMRYKNLQLVAQQVSGRRLKYFTLRDQLVTQQKHLLRVEEMQRIDWLICLEWIQDDSIFCVTICEFDEKRATKPCSTFRNNLSHGKLRVFVCHISPPLCPNWSSMYSKVSLTRYSSFFARTNAFHLRIG